MKKYVLSQLKAQSIQMSSFIEAYVRLLQHIEDLMNFMKAVE